MVDSVGASLSGVTSAQSSYRAPGASFVSSASFTNAPSSSAAGRYQVSRAVFNQSDARALLDVSVSSATQVVDALKDLISSKNVTAAENSTALRRALSKIDNLIAKAEFNNANLLSSSSQNIILQTSSYGGKVSVSTQPLDRAGLGLSTLTSAFQQGSRDGFEAITKAYSTAVNRLNTLQQLHNAFSSGNALDKSYQSVLSSQSGATLSRGSFVNLQA